MLIVKELISYDIYFILAKGTNQIGFTVDVCESKLKILGSFSLNLWDCGGCIILFKLFFISFNISTLT